MKIILGLFAFVANAKYILQVVVNTFNGIKSYIKEYRAKKREEAYKKRKEEREKISQQIEVEAKKEGTEESDEALRNLHRNMK